MEKFVHQQNPFGFEEAVGYDAKRSAATTAFKTTG